MSTPDLQADVRALNRAIAAGKTAAAAEIRARIRKSQGPSIMDRGPQERQVSVGTAAQAGTREGLTMGWGSEAMAGLGARADRAYQGLTGAGVPGAIARPVGAVASMFYPSAVEDDVRRRQLRDTYEQDLQLGRRQHPEVAYGTEVGGALVSGGASGKAAAPFLNQYSRGRIGRVGSFAGLGAVEGGIYGAGMDHDNRLGGAGVGAGVGVAGGLLGPMIATPLTATGRAISRAFGSGNRVAQKQAENIVRQVAMKEGVEPGQVISWLNQNPNMTVGDFSDRFRQTMGGALALASKEGREGATRFYTGTGRNRGAAGRLEQQADEIFGTNGRTYRQVVDELKETRGSIGQEQYDNIFAANAGVKPQLSVEDMKLLKDPDIQRAMAEGKALAKKMGGNTDTLWGQLHWAQNALGDTINASMKKDQTPVRATALMQQRRQLQSILDEQLDGYSAARAQYADTYQIQRAADQGRQLFSGNRPMEVLDDMAELTGDQRQAFIVGVKDAVREQIQRKGDDAVKGIFSTNLRNRLTRVLGEDVDELFNAVDAEMKAGKSGLLADNVNAAVQADPELITGGLLVSAGIGNPVMLASQLVQRIRVLSENVTPQVADQLLDLIAKPPRTRAEVEAIERAMTQIITRHYGASGAAGMLAGSTSGTEQGILED